MNTENRVCVVGLGYVGLTLATVLAENGFKVTGLEKRQEIVDLINSGQPHFSEVGLHDSLYRVIQSKALVARSSLEESEPNSVYIITVGTPLGADGLARLDMIEAATQQVADTMPDGALVILRSTVKVGTARNVVMPILKASGKSVDIAMCPERTLEGKALIELRELPQIIGADEQAVRDRAARLFRDLTKSIVQVSSLEAAEIVKLVDNTYRDVQFAFANEVARLCECFDVNAYEVISSGKLGYQRTNVPLPGLVGGPCLEKDPHILVQSARNKGIELEITKGARLVNERQPFETMQFIVSQMSQRGIGPGAKVALLGIAFKGVPATDDLRGSMSVKVMDALRRSRPDVELHLFDPVIEATLLEQQFPDVIACKSLLEAVRGAAVVIIGNNHPALSEYTPAFLCEQMASEGFIYDYWNHFSNSSAARNKAYFAVGNVKLVRA
jgi:UDP-N-acetyl-D-mannosaminuronic acid dehydrogenase